jgi:propanol-preferring alcohol dehydrogenase
MTLKQAGGIDSSPLTLVECDVPTPGPGELLIHVVACGICHTDLHIVEGDITPPTYPIVPGHQVIGKVEKLGDGVDGWREGDTVGIPWLHSTCGTCGFCLRGEENLCFDANFTGFHRHGGYAEWLISNASYTLKIPAGLIPEKAAPLLCAGIIGYRSLKLAEVRPGERIGLVGFGASAHIAIQIARHWNCEVYVFTRSLDHRKLAQHLGAAWVGGSEQDPPEKLDRALLFAPVGDLIPQSLAKIRRGGTLAINAIHMSPIPSMDYKLLYGERTLRSVANATNTDGVEFLELAEKIPIETTIETYNLEDANRALHDLKTSRINGAGVLIP